MDFTIADASNHVIDTLLSVPVTGGKAECPNYSLPAGTPVGAYTVEASYRGSSNYAASSSTTFASLQVAAAMTSTSVSIAPSPQPFTAAGAGTFDLTADVTNDVVGDVVGEGTVTFTIKDGFDHVIDTVLGVSVIHGHAVSASYALPAGTGTGSYTLAASYSGAADYVASSSTNLASLEVAPANTATSVAVMPSSQPFTATGAGSFDLTADVTNTDATDVVGEGTVTFTIMDGASNVIATVSSTVSNGQAVYPDYFLPAGTWADGYTVQATYSGTSNYVASTAVTSAPLTVDQASTATSVGVGPSLQSFAAAGAGPFDLTANVMNTDATDVVAEGDVTFTILDGSNHVIDTVSNVAVSNGQAVATNYSLPAGTPVGSYSVEASYSGSANYVASDSTMPASFSVVPANTATTVSVMPEAQTFAGSGAFDLTAMTTPMLRT